MRKRHRIKPKKSILRRPIFWFSLLFLILAGAIIYFVVFWQGFQIKNIIISGNQKVVTSEREQLVSTQADKNFLFFNSKSIFLLNSGKLDNLILKNYPEIGSADTQKKYPDAISVYVRERQPVAIICGFKNQPQGLCFYMDENGVIFDEVKTEDANFPVVEQYEEKEATLGDQVLVQQIALGVSKIQKNFQENFNPLTVRKADIVSADRMDVTTNEGWQVYFNLSSDINLQIAKLILLLQKDFLKPASRAKLQYIDLRFENKAYYK